MNDTNPRGARVPGGTAHRRFVVGCGLVGWATVAVATADVGFPFGDVNGLAVSLFLGFGLVARLLAFEALRGMAISLDSALYIAAIWVVGPLAAAWLAAIVLALDGTRRLWVELRARREGLSAGWALVSLLATSGTVAAQFLVVGWVAPIETIQEAIARSPEDLHWWVLGAVPLLTLLFIALNYGTGGVALWLQGHSARDVWRRLLRYGVLAECLQIPASMAAVEIFDPSRPFNFILLGFTFLLINGGFKALTERGMMLRQRVLELGALNELGRATSATLLKEERIALVAQATLRLLPRAELVSVGLLEEAAPALSVRLFRAADVGGAPRPREPHETLAAGEGLAQRLVAERRALTLREAEAAPGGVARGDWERGARSWVGVPLVVYDDVIGYLAAQSSEPGAFSADDRRVLESLGQQAASTVDNARLYELATIDGLTGLYVRRYFDQRLAEEWRRSTRYQHDFSVIICDLDNFKALNDTHGHLCGDRALRESAGAIRRAVRNVDLAARFGGEELCVLLPRATSAEAALVAERIRAELMALRVPAPSGEVSLTASFGVASLGVCGPDGGEKALLRAADEALYRAKAAGKNRVVVHGDDGRTLRLA